MGFPVIASTSNANIGSSSVTATLPAGVQQDDLLILAISRLYACTMTWPAGWSPLVTQPTGNYAFEARYKLAGASETNPTVSFSTAEAGQYRFFRITGHEPGTAPAATTTPATGTSNAPNSAALDPADWGTEDTLWISIVSYTDVNGYSAAPTAYPASYTAGAQRAQFPVLSYAYRNLTASSEDPGAFAVAQSVTWYAATIAIRPMLATPAAAALAATSNLTAGAQLLLPAAVTMATTSNLAAAAPTQQIAASLAAQANLSAPAALPKAAATLAASSNLTAELTYYDIAQARLSAASLFSGLTTPPTVLAAQSQFVTTGLLTPAMALGVLSATAHFDVIGFGFIPVDARMDAEATLTGTLFTTWADATQLNSIASLTADAKLPGAAATLSVVAQFRLTGPYLVTSGSDLVLMVVSANLVATATSWTPALVVPTGAVRHPVRTPVYRLYAADTRTGRISWELPLATATWNNPINDVGALRATLVVEDALEQMFAQGSLDPRGTLREVLTGPYRFSLVLAWGNAVVFAGPYLPSSNPGDSPTVDVGAAELTRMFDKRLLIDPAGSFADLSIGPVSAPELVRQIITLATTGYGRTLPITCANPPNPQGPYTAVYHWWDLTKASDAISSVTAQEDGPDYRLDPYLYTGSDGLYVAWELSLGAPYLGQAIAPWVFDDTQATVTQDIDAARMVSTVYVPGTGQDEKKLTAYAVDTTLIDAGFPALEDVDGAYSSETDITALTAYAEADIRRYAAPVDKWTLKVPADGYPALGSYRVGDPMIVDIRRHPIIPPGVYPRRITEVSGDQTPWVSLASTESA